MKKLMALIGAAIICFSFSSCTKEEKELNVDEFITYTLENINFKDELTKINDSMVQRLYTLEDGVTASVYVGSGATAEEVAVFKVTSDEEKQKMLKNVNAHIDAQKDAFKSYVPKEVEKLEKAVIIEYGNYIIVLISDEPNAKTIAEKHLN